MNCRILWTPRAKRRFEDLAEFLAEKSPSAAAKMVRRALAGVAHLGQQPQLGRPWRQDGSHPIRRLILDDYIIYYERDEEARLVSILSVRHGRESPLDEGAPLK